MAIVAALLVALVAGACAQTPRPAGHGDTDPLAPELRARVAAFIDSGGGPTTAQTVSDRTDLLRHWGNAWALTGHTLPVDLTLAIHQTVLPAIESRPGQSPYLAQLVADGKLGFKSGEGFRRWTPEQQAELRAKVLQHLKKAREDDA